MSVPDVLYLKPAVGKTRFRENSNQKRNSKNLEVEKMAWYVTSCSSKSTRIQPQSALHLSHAYGPSTGKVETGGSLEHWPARVVYLSSVKVRDPVSVNSRAKSNLGREGLISSVRDSHHRLSSKKVKGSTQDRNLEPRTEVVVRENACILSCSSWLAQYAFLYPPGPPAQGWLHP